MWTLKVAGWWLLTRYLDLTVGLLTAVLYLPMALLEAICERRDAAHLEWLMACTDRRLARRKRMNFEGGGNGHRS